MVPARVVALDALPLTANGKLDRAGVVDPKADSVRSGHTGADPVGPDQVGLVVEEIWRSALHLEVVDRRANFFDVGGTP